MRHRASLTELVLGALLATGGSMPAAAQDDYLLQPGDVLEVTVAGLPAMTVRTPVQIDGRLGVPGAGTLGVAGETLEDTASMVQTALASQLMPVYLPDGREVIRMLKASQISVAIVEYRPVFVTGDVTMPGELPYRPGMTARQAVAAAGGAGLLRDQAPSFDPIALRAQYGEAWHAATAASARVWRLNRELGHDAPFPVDAWPEPPGPGTTLKDILDVEADLAEERALIQRRQEAFLERQIEQIDAQTKVLQDQLETEKANEEVDAEAFAMAEAARDRGTVTNARLSDIRSAALISTTRRLQAEVSLMQLVRRRMEIEHERATLDGARRLQLLDELQQARITEGRERARLAGAAEKLGMAGVPLPGNDRRDSDPEIRITRANAPGEIPVHLDARVQPGDVVTVTLGRPTGEVLQSKSQVTGRVNTALQ